MCVYIYIYIHREGDTYLFKLRHSLCIGSLRGPHALLKNNTPNRHTTKEAIHNIRVFIMTYNQQIRRTSRFPTCCLPSTTAPCSPASSAAASARDMLVVLIDVWYYIVRVTI